MSSYRFTDSSRNRVRDARGSTNPNTTEQPDLFRAQFAHHAETDRIIHTRPEQRITPPYASDQYIPPPFSDFEQQHGYNHPSAYEIPRSQAEPFQPPQQARGPWSQYHHPQPGMPINPFQGVVGESLQTAQRAAAMRDSRNHQHAHMMSSQPYVPAQRPDLYPSQPRPEIWPSQWQMPGQQFDYLRQRTLPEAGSSRQGQTLDAAQLTGRYDVSRANELPPTMGYRAFDATQSTRHQDVSQTNELPSTVEYEAHDEYYTVKGTAIDINRPRVGTEASVATDEGEMNMLHDLGLHEKVAWVDGKGPDVNYNCHGFTFADSQGWIADPGDVQKILNEHQFRPTSRPLTDDVIIYRDSDRNITHSGVVVDIEDGKPIIHSKFGKYSLLEHDPEDFRDHYGQYEFYHTNRRDGRHLLTDFGDE